MADTIDSPLTPTKGSTVANLLTGAKARISTLFTSAASGATIKTTGDSTSLLMSPMLWAGALLAAGAVWFFKFRKPSRKGVKFRR